MTRVSAKHIDGTFAANERDKCLDWLKEEAPAGECRILTNVRCLSEGVDVPSLDAVLFLAARNSQVDVVQSVGRVMRKAEGKKFGYIIIPVIVPATEEPEKALDKNDRYKVVWTVLNALRAHDDRFNAVVNQIDLNKKRPNKLMIGATEITFRNGEAVSRSESETTEAANSAVQQLRLQFEALQSVVFARLVKKVGNRLYWEQWAKSVAEIAERQIARINTLIETNEEHRKAFDDFLNGLRRNINPSITKEDAVQMLSQHIITRPVFDALFEGYSFASHNPVSVSMNAMLAALHGEQMGDDDETLQKFYDFVRRTLTGLDNAEAKQGVIVRLYENFFAKAFKKMVERLGIVYTPVEVVDFIIHSVNDVLKKEFGKSLQDRDVHILDPFTGTGTFITRLIQSGLIDKEHLPHKYKNEMFANEIVLLAYYIAAVNIENAYHDAINGTRTPSSATGDASSAATLTNDNFAGGTGVADEGVRVPSYIPFDGICLTDTFQLGEEEPPPIAAKETFKQNSERVERQKRAPLKVIFGNPPYSVGQTSANDNAQNQKYDHLDGRIAETYAALTKATNKNSLYDSYFKAFRWATDRLGKDGGVVAFVSNGAWIDGNAQDGFRKSIEDEFTSIYVFNTRGNARTSGELRQKEAGNVFGSGSRTPIAITLLVKKPQDADGLVPGAVATEFPAATKAIINYHDIGDYLKREEKLEAIKKFSSVANESMPWTTLEPNEHGDWISLRNSAFDNFIPIGDKGEKTENAFFVNKYSGGLKSGRDAFCYNSSKNVVAKNMQTLADFYNLEREDFHHRKKSKPDLKLEDAIDFDSTKITWNRGLKNDLERNKKIIFDSSNIIIGLHRPFIKQRVYFARELNDMVYQMPKLFPNPSFDNKVVCVSGIGGTRENSAIIADDLVDLNCLDAGTQCFPLYYYEEKNLDNPTLFDKASEPQYIRRDGISDWILKQAHERYGKDIKREDIFYYVYGFLHSPEYRAKFANDLKKMLPRIPLVENRADFTAFSKAGKTLADLHLHYEKISPYPDLKVTGEETNNFRVGKMRFIDKETKAAIQYNSSITVSNIPAKAYEYVINGKSAIEWIIERYQVKQDKPSGIINDPNNWSDEVGNPRYILDLLLSVVNVSVQTVDIVDGLPKMKFE